MVPVNSHQVYKFTLEAMELCRVWLACVLEVFAAGFPRSVVLPLSKPLTPACVRPEQEAQTGTKGRVLFKNAQIVRRSPGLI